MGIGFPSGFLILLAFMNDAVRPTRVTPWYGQVVQAVEQGYHPNFLFVGSSRMRAAIHSESWDRVMAERFHVRTSGLNLGMGWCTPMEHYFGLRSILRANPAALRGTAVLIEAGEGIGFPETWRQNWIVEDRWDLLVPYLESSDFGNVWKSSTPKEAKVAIAAGLWFPAFDQTARLRHDFRSQIDTIGSQLQHAVWENAASMGPTEADLSTDGGIRADKKGVELAKFMADSMAQADLRDQKPYGDWDSTVLADIVRLLKDAGAMPIFVRIPYSPTQAVPLATPLRQADRIAFEAAVRRWGLPPVVAAPFQPRPEDFPDKWHLRKTLAPDFTRSLALAYLGAFVR